MLDKNNLKKRLRSVESFVSPTRKISCHRKFICRSSKI